MSVLLDPREHALQIDSGVSITMVKRVLEHPWFSSSMSTVHGWQVIISTAMMPGPRPDADADADACSMRLPRPHFHPPGNCVSFFDVVLILLQSGTGLAVTWLGLAVTRVPPQFSHQFVPSLRWRPRAVLLLLERCPQMLLRQACYHRQELTIVALARLRTATCSMSHPRPRFHPPGTRHCAVCEGCC